MEYKPSHYSKKVFLLNDKIMTVAYYGLGKWSDGKIDEESLVAIKEQFKSNLSQFRGSEHLLLNVTSDKFWVYFNLKIK